jgi:uncharacterized protein YecT (DUF1311 family)
MIPRLSGAVVGVVLAGMAATAQADPVMECGNRYGSQVEIGDCLADVERDVDAAMDIALGFAMSSAKDLDAITERKVVGPALEAGQAAWLAYRDRHCNYVGSTYGGGSGTGATIRSCRIELGRARSGHLMEFAR